MWLYPMTGSGVWFNTGNTAAAYNKPAWLIKYGQSAGIGSTPAQIMDAMATMTCTGYQQLASCNATCADADKDNPQYCWHVSIVFVSRQTHLFCLSNNDTSQLSWSQRSQSRHASRRRQADATELLLERRAQRRRHNVHLW